MQEVFEKIIKKLEEESFLTTNDDGETNELSIGVVDLKEAIEIVKQVAAKYNNGWIPCSERLPEEYTVLCCDTYGEIIIGHPYFDELSDTNYSAESKNEIMYNCIAWQLLQEPYQPKGE